MEPFVYGKRNLIHIIDLKETLRGMIRACRFLAKVVEGGEDVLFVGTKRQARATVAQVAERCGMPCVSERWLGGTLTNFNTIRSRLKRLIRIEQIEESGEIDTLPKKEVARIMREKRKLTRNLAGIRNMDRLPGALFVVDPRHEHNAVREARRLDIPTVALIDTDSDPDFIDIPIPGNDDAMRSIAIVCQKLTDAILQGKSRRPGAILQAAEGSAPESPPPAPAPVAPPPVEPTATDEVPPVSSEPKRDETVPATEPASETQS